MCGSVYSRGQNEEGGGGILMFLKNFKIPKSTAQTDSRTTHTKGREREGYSGTVTAAIIKRPHPIQLAK